MNIQETPQTSSASAVMPCYAREVAVLCCAKNSVYKNIAGVDCYDIARNCKTYPGNMPIVAHPPCRSWSAFTRHQAKPLPSEKDLGLWCAEQLRKNGGVLEHPAHSLLFDAAGLPRPGFKNGDLETIAVWQAWWGYPMKKNTWLCFSKIDPHLLKFPFQLHDQGRDRRRQQLMSKHQRAATCMDFALWLVDAARYAA